MTSFFVPCSSAFHSPLFAVTLILPLVPGTQNFHGITEVKAFLLLTNQDLMLAQQQSIRNGQDTNFLTFTLWKLYHYNVPSRPIWQQPQVCSVPAWGYCPTLYPFYSGGKYCGSTFSTGISATEGQNIFGSNCFALRIFKWADSTLLFSQRGKKTKCIL